MYAIAQAIAIGIDADVPQHEDRISGTHALAVAHQHRAHDAALQVLHRPPIEIDLDEGGGDHRHRERREAHPRCDRHECREDDPPSDARQARACLRLVRVFENLSALTAARCPLLSTLRVSSLRKAGCCTHVTLRRKALAFRHTVTGSVLYLQGRGGSMTRRGPRPRAPITA